MTRLEKLRDQLAEASVNRDHLELHEADARVRHYKFGFDAASAEYEKIINEMILALQEHHTYAYECRMDWSDYDGRSHLHFANSVNEKAFQKLKDFRGESSETKE